MRNIAALVAVLVAVLLIAVPDAAYAQGCARDAITQMDMAGLYVSPEHRMRVEVYGCGGTFIQWENEYGTHGAGYGAVRPLPGGGYASRSMVGEQLDGAYTVAVKPAEPGFVQLITVGPYGEGVRFYRLRRFP